jgi:hypothetical protein
MVVQRSVLDDLARIANSPRRDTGSTRAIYSYPAKFQAHVPAEIIRQFTREGDLVVDPYCGGGTTGLEALHLGRPSVGVDLSPFACLVARVKTTPVDATQVRAALERALAATGELAVLDEEDTRCLGPAVSAEVTRAAAGMALEPDPAIRDLLRLSLVHAVKIAGRRDFDDDTLLPLVGKRVGKILRALGSLPAGPRPVFRLGSNHKIPEVPDGAARLVVTSPPYKDLDVEYGLLQIQRPALGKSKRSQVIWRILGAPTVAKSSLCGGRGERYWETLAPSLAEIRRVLAKGAPAFFWTGFKTEADRDRFVAHLAAARLPVTKLLTVTLSRDRVASSRSTHHGRETGMMAADYLIAAVAA